MTGITVDSCLKPVPRLHASAEESPATRKTYIGLSASSGCTSTAIVSGGQLLFAEDYAPGSSAYDLAGLTENDTRTLLTPLAQYCEPDTDIVIAVPREGHSPPLANVLAGSLRTLAYTRRSSSHALSWLANILKLQIYKSRGGKSVKFEQRYYRRHLACAAAACITSPYSEALCMVLEGPRRRPCSQYIYRDSALFEIADVIGEGLYEARGTLCQDQCEACWGREDVAQTGQAVFEEQLYSSLRNLSALGRFRNLALTGGGALNSRANGNILRCTEFESLYVPCFPASTGSAVGAALLAHHQDNRLAVVRHPGFQTPYLGSDFPSARFQRLVSSLGLSGIRQCHGDAPERAASCLASGMIVAWVQGRAELGPRALGNRSILADPRQHNIRARLASPNGADPRSTWPSFSVLHEYGAEWFENYQVSPYMERALRFRAKVIRRIPEVINAIGTAQVQSVKRDWNPGFYDLIFAFYKITGIPMVINANCELSGRGFVATPDELLRMFGERLIDVMFVDETLLAKPYLQHDADSCTPAPQGYAALPKGYSVVQ